MSDRNRSLVRCVLIGAALLLAGCQRQPVDDQTATLDNQIIGNESDPALTSALQDPILTDPALTQQSNKNAVRPPAGPVQAQYPPERGHRDMQRIARGEGEGEGCAANFEHSPSWARRLPAEFPVFPGARVTDAMGNDTGGCRMRVVSFASEAPPQRVLVWYRERAASAGFSHEHQRQQRDHVLAGTKDDDAYYLIVTPRRGGSDVSLILNNGV
jgi:hypothetical protein